MWPLKAIGNDRANRTVVENPLLENAKNSVRANVFRTCPNSGHAVSARVIPVLCVVGAAA
jgi:hypothetical protein